MNLGVQRRLPELTDTRTRSHLHLRGVGALNAVEKGKFLSYICEETFTRVGCLPLSSIFVSFENLGITCQDLVEFCAQDHRGFNPPPYKL